MTEDEPELGKWNGDQFEGLAYVVTVNVADGHDLPDNVVAALDQLSEAIAANAAGVEDEDEDEDEDEVEGFAFGAPNKLLLGGGSLNPMGALNYCACHGADQGPQGPPPCNCKDIYFATKGRRGLDF